jgi:Rnl2 family RNA ligase
MKFEKYPSIKNSYDTKTIQHIQLMGLSINDIDWCVSEKLHGANLAIYSNGTCQTASRNNMLSEEDSNAFYSFGRIKAGVYDQINKLFDIISHANFSNELDYIIVYGELYGGSYPHDKITRNNKVAMVQKGVFYSPNVHFRIFDIKVHASFVQPWYFSYTELVDICNSLNIPAANILFKGTMDECLAYPNDNMTTIPAEFGLPAIDDNVMEGVVIRPNITVFMNNGERAMLKNKNDIFKERNSERKHEKVEVIISDTLQENIDEVSTFINDNRLAAVISKGSPLTRSLIGPYIKDLTHDVFVAYNDECSPNHMDKSEQKIFNRFVSTKCRNLILTTLNGG